MKMKNLSYWVKSVKQDDFSKLDKEIYVDVAVIGGGITGLTTALMLSERNINATIFEANELGHGATGYTTAKVTCQHKLIYSDLINHIDEDTARYYADANKTALENIRRIIREYKIDCDFKTTSSNVYAGKKGNVEKLEKEFIAAKSLGFDIFLDKDVSLPFKAYANLRLENQGIFHPVKYIKGITKALRDKAVQIYEHTRITEIEKHDYYVLITDNRQKIYAKQVVIATKYPILNKKKLMFTKLYVERSYVVAAVMPNFRIDGYYINAENEVRSIREYNDNEERLILVAGANHEAEDCEKAEQSYLELIKFSKELDEDAQIRYKWSTQDCMTVDKMPYIGELSDDMEGVYIATGYNKWGMNQSMVAAMILSDAIAHTPEKWHNIFNLKRDINADAVKELIKQGADVARDYVKKLAPAEIYDIDLLMVGEGRIVKYDGDIVGAYKDETGEVFTIIPKCPHLGCRLKFNQAEKTWDCPCHASRFTYKGEIIDSPAVKKLDIKD